MSANRIYLVCEQHQGPEDALLIAERGGCEVPYDAANFRNADRWFNKHADCGRGKDHFKLAYGRPLDWDIAPPAEATVAGGVKVAMALNGAH